MIFTNGIRWRVLKRINIVLIHDETAWTINRWYKSSAQLYSNLVDKSEFGRNLLSQGLCVRVYNIDDIVTVNQRVVHIVSKEKKKLRINSKYKAPNQTHTWNHASIFDQCKCNMYIVYIGAFIIISRQYP